MPMMDRREPFQVASLAWALSAKGPKEFFLACLLKNRDTKISERQMTSRESHHIGNRSIQSS